MILGYFFGGVDNGSYMFDDEDDNIPVCSKCGYVTDFRFVSKTFKLRNTKYDISCTYDNHTIVSKRFKEFCEGNGYHGLEFKELPNNREFYSFIAYNILPFDTDRAKLECIGYCVSCGNYRSISPAFPIAIKDLTSPLGDGIFRTDINFYTGNEKHPLLIIGIETHDKMKRERFKGIYYEEFGTELSALRE